MDSKLLKTQQVHTRIYKGVCLFDRCEIEDIQNMSIRDDDIWVLSFPRSGTTVTQEIVYLLQTKLDIETARARPLDERFPFLDFYVPDMPLFRGLKPIEEETAQRLIKSHLHYHIMPQKLFESKCKKIYVMRNPKDTVVSCFMLTKFLKQCAPDSPIDQFVESWLDGKTYSTPWWIHVRDYWQNRDQINNLLILRYEDINKDIRTVIRQIADHLAVSVTDDEVDKIAQHCSFNEMKSSKSANAAWMEDHWLVDKEFGGHIRKGKVGGWHDYISREMSEMIDNMVHEKLDGLDLKFDYGS